MRKKVGKTKLVAMVMATVMLATACSTGKTKEDVTIEETTTEEPKPAVELAAGFDEEFVIKMGEELYIGQEDICIKLDGIMYDESYKGTDINYSLTIGDKVYSGYGSWIEELGSSITQEVFSENRVKLISADKDVSVTLMITSGTDIKEPIALSGNEEDEYITSQPEYVETDDFIIFLDKDIKIYGNTITIISTIIDQVEKEAGLKLDNDSYFATLRDDMLEKLFGQDVFAGVDHGKEKFHIYVVDAEKSSSSCGTYGIVINPKDLEFPAGEGMAIVHELVHSVQLVNGVTMGSVMDEGFATYITGKITAKDEIINFNFDSDMNYSGYDVKITKENAEEEFLREYDGDNWDSYLYGYRFVTFLYENYGNDVFLNIFNDATDSIEEYYTSIEPSNVIPIIKENTSNDVFEKFADWLGKNHTRFEG